MIDQQQQRIVNHGDALEGLKSAFLILADMDPDDITDISGRDELGIKVLIALRLIDQLPDGRALIRS